MVQQVLPWDALFLAGFAYSGYRTLGRWLKYTDDVAKSQSGERIRLASVSSSCWHVLCTCNSTAGPGRRCISTPLDHLMSSVDCYIIQLLQSERNGHACRVAVSTTTPHTGDGAKPIQGVEGVLLPAAERSTCSHKACSRSVWLLCVLL